MGQKVTIFDTTLRDGEQSPGCTMHVAEKIRMAGALVEMGVDVIEAGFPVASAGDEEAVREIGRSFRDVSVAALARATRTDIDCALRALAFSRRPRLHTFIATSDIHLVHKLKKSRAQALDEASEAVRWARSRVDDVEFSAEDATRTDLGYLTKVCRCAADAGAGIINLPDTVGYSTPADIGCMFKRVSEAVEGRAVLSAHCHNDLGLAVANSLAAIEAGARQVECTVNGIGERAGNCSLEEIVMVLKTRQDHFPFDVGIVTERLYPASQLLSELISFGPQPNKAIVGANAFAHEAGIHQDGFLKERTTYEIIDPRTVGVPESRLVLGKHSGRHALAQRCVLLGYRLTPQMLDGVYRVFIDMADRKKGVSDQEIDALVRERVGSAAAGHPPRESSATPFAPRPQARRHGPSPSASRCAGCDSTF